MGVSKSTRAVVWYESTRKQVRYIENLMLWGDRLLKTDPYEAAAKFREAAEAATEQDKRLMEFEEVVKAYNMIQNKKGNL